MNGLKIHTFVHRLPVKHVSKFDVAGGFQVEQLQLRGFPHIEGVGHH